jgi:hypothetical protein
MAAGFKTIHHAAIRHAFNHTNHHANYTACFHYASDIHFHITVGPRSSAIQPHKRRSTQHQCQFKQVNVHNPFIHHKAGK